MPPLLPATERSTSSKTGGTGNLLPWALMRLASLVEHKEARVGDTPIMLRYAHSYPGEAEFSVDTEQNDNCRESPQ